MKLERLPARGAGVRPVDVCNALLAALDAAEGRRRARKRNQTPDAIGLDTKRVVLEAAIRDDPDPDQFEAWLLRYATAQTARDGHGSAWAMAQAVLEEWRLARAMPQFAIWLADGAPSADASPAASDSEPWTRVQATDPDRRRN